MYHFSDSFFYSKLGTSLTCTAVECTNITSHTINNSTIMAQIQNGYTLNRDFKEKIFDSSRIRPLDLPTQIIVTVILAIFGFDHIWPLAPGVSSE